MNKVIRTPVKKSAILKKELITKKGFELICEKGFYNVTTIDIARYAGVSTGIIYQYFKDKKDILISGLKEYSLSIFYPLIDILERINPNNLEEILKEIIDTFIKTHKLKEEAHDNLMAMSYLDKDIAKIFYQNEIEMTKRISTILINNGFKKDNINEKVHLIMGILDNYCHEKVYHRHDILDYEVMEKEVIKLIIKILS